MEQNEQTQNQNANEQNGNEQNQNGAVTLTQEQLDAIVKKAMGRAAADVRKELQTATEKLTTMEQELQTLRAAATNPNASAAEKKEAKGDAEELARQIEEMKAARRTAETEMQSLRQKAAQAEKDAVSARQEAINERRESFINSMLDKADVEWVNREAVKKFVRDSVKWDSDQSRFIITNDAGEQRLNMAYDPMTDGEFIADFAAKNDFLVKSRSKAGNGSGEAQRNAAMTGKYGVEQIFGKKSDSRLANELAMKKPQEYARLKAEARAKGLIA